LESGKLRKRWNSEAGKQEKTGIEFGSQETRKRTYPERFFPTSSFWFYGFEIPSLLGCWKFGSQEATKDRRLNQESRKLRRGFKFGSQEAKKGTAQRVLPHFFFGFMVLKFISPRPRR
jgi:hypothetical protein